MKRGRAKESIKSRTRKLPVRRECPELPGLAWNALPLRIDCRSRIIWFCPVLAVLVFRLPGEPGSVERVLLIV